MKQTNHIIEAIVIACGLAVLGVSIKWGIDDFANKDRKVTVKGLAEKEVEADKVTWPISTKEIGNSLPDLYQKIGQTEATIKRFLTDNGVKAEEINERLLGNLCGARGTSCADQLAKAVVSGL